MASSREREMGNKSGLWRSGSSKEQMYLVNRKQGKPWEQNILLRFGPDKGTYVHAEKKWG